MTKENREMAKGRDNDQAPGTIISDQVAELLMAFNISATPEGMRDYFKNK